MGPDLSHLRVGSGLITRPIQQVARIWGLYRHWDRILGMGARVGCKVALMRVAELPARVALYGVPCIWTTSIGLL